MIDTYGRDINYMRVSITDRCNLRCVYCMPGDGIEKRSHLDIMSFEEIEEVVGAAATLGISKVRITGGEPLVRRGVTGLCAAIKRIEGINELALTTNGVMLDGMAEELKAAGVDRVNISLDTLQPEKFTRITRCGRLEDTLRGIRAAMKTGLGPVKINCVLMGGVNDDEIADFVALTRHYPVQVRFIELMPIGGGEEFGAGAFLPDDEVLKRVPELRPIGGSGVARVYALPDAPGTVGLISPLSNHFCDRCSRLRLTPDGFLKPCLHSSEEISVRNLHGEELLGALRTAIAHKPARHGALSGTEHSEAGRDMSRIGG